MAVRRSKAKTALRGSVNNIIMESLYSGEKYGYEIIKEVEEKTNGKIKLKQPSLYSSLSRFEAKGLIDSYWQDSDIGGKRHYYRLTDSGVEYYKKNILKEEDEVEEIVVKQTPVEEVSTPAVNDEEYLEDQISEYEIDEHEDSQNIEKYEYDVEAKINSLLNNEVEESNDYIESTYEEIAEEPIYSEEDLEEDLRNEEYIPDHEFRTPTPITDIIEEKEDVKEYNLNDIDTSENAFDDIMEYNDSNDIFDDIDLNKTYEDKTSSTEIISDKKPKIITDENGITKMYYENEELTKRNNKVFDNVVYRTNNNDTIFKARANATPKQKELTDEERELRSQKFIEKFDIKSEQLKREKQLANTNNTKSREDQKIDYNYKSKLNDLFNSADNDEESFVSQEVSFNNSNINYDIDNNEGTFDNTTDIDNYTSELNNSGYSVKVFSKEKNKESSIKYLQVNRAKFTFGLCMLAFMLIQTTIMLILFKNKNLLNKDQFWVFELSYIIVGIVALLYCIPVFISPNKQASNNFKLGYSLMFGLLAFFITVILTYAINTFMGMELVNIKYYLATLIVPIAMALNFIFGPIIYWLITQSKRFYQ